MPQKKNPDGLELMRAKSGVLGGYAATVKNIVRSLPSGYNRDLQDTKEPFLRGLELLLSMLAVARTTMDGLEVDEKALRRGFTKDIYATDAAFEAVQAGVPFREAYKQVGLNLDKLAERRPEDALAQRTHLGGTANLGLEKLDERLANAVLTVQERRHQVEAALSTLAGFEIHRV